MFKDIEQIQKSLENIAKSNNKLLEDSLKNLSKNDPNKSIEIRNLANDILSAKTQEEAQENLNLIIKKCQQL